jgi:hypothetical protein
LWKGPGPLVLKVTGEGVEPLVPEFPVPFEPLHGLPHRIGRKHAVDHAALLFPLEESGVLQYAQVLHEAGQRHVERLRERAYGTAAGGERREYAPSRRVGQRRENCVERLRTRLNHMV